MYRDFGHAILVHSARKVDLLVRRLPIICGVQSNAAQCAKMRCRILFGFICAHERAKQVKTERRKKKTSEYQLDPRQRPPQCSLGFVCASCDGSRVFSRSAGHIADICTTVFPQPSWQVCFHRRLFAIFDIVRNSALCATRLDIDGKTGGRIRGRSAVGVRGRAEAREWSENRNQNRGNAHSASRRKRQNQETERNNAHRAGAGDTERIENDDGFRLQIALRNSQSKSQGRANCTVTSLYCSTFMQFG